jgi:hypothetical protein
MLENIAQNGNEAALIEAGKASAVILRTLEASGLLACGMSDWLPQCETIGQNPISRTHLIERN